MDKITINGNFYHPLDAVAWDDAIAQGGFYFDRARWLGLPQPLALLFAPGREDYLSAMSDYHALFAEAEAAIIARMRHLYD
jgi:hypothetical protein